MRNQWLAAARHLLAIAPTLALQMMVTRKWITCCHFSLLRKQPILVSGRPRPPSQLSLLPPLDASFAANPTEKEARKADRDCRAAYKERLLERVAIIQRRLDDENEKLLRKQHAFSRTRDHAEGAEEEFERYDTPTLHAADRGLLIATPLLCQVLRRSNVSHRHPRAAA